MRALLLCLLTASAAAAPQVSLNGSLGKSAALLVIQGQVKTVRVGQTVDGVRLLEVAEGQATVEVEGKRLQLTLGAAPVSQGAASAGKKIVLGVGQGGHFLTMGTINGHAARFIDVVRQRLLTVDMQPAIHRRHRHRRMHMVGRRDVHRIEIARFLVEHDPPVLVDPALGELLLDFVSPAFIDLGHADQLDVGMTSNRREVRPGHAVGTKAGMPDRFTRLCPAIRGHGR